MLYNFIGMSIMFVLCKHVLTVYLMLGRQMKVENPLGVLAVRGTT